MKNSKIEWTDHTFNPWHGCMKVSEGCKNCYAEKQDARFHPEEKHWGAKSPRLGLSDANWKKPLQWNSDAQSAGTNAKVFCASMADVFEDHPDVIEHRKRLMQLIPKTPFLTWQLLTKRPENIMALLQSTRLLCDIGSPEHDMLDKWLNGDPPENVWIGTSVENQSVADIRIPILYTVPAVIRFLSCEPLLGPLDISRYMVPKVVRHSHKNMLTGDTGIALNAIISEINPDLSKNLHWVIVGGESGDNARAMHPRWASDLQKQCEAAGVAFFFKQWGEYGIHEIIEGGELFKKRIRLSYDGTVTKGFGWIEDAKSKDIVRMYAYGKDRSGSMLNKK